MMTPVITNTLLSETYHQAGPTFVQTCEFLAPLVAENHRAKAISNFAITRMLMTRFPELSHADAHIAILTVERMHRNGQLHTLLDENH